jgi:hypothetical protein
LKNLHVLKKCSDFENKENVQIKNASVSKKNIVSKKVQILNNAKNRKEKGKKKKKQKKSLDVIPLFKALMWLLSYLLHASSENPIFLDRAVMAPLCLVL